MKFIDYHMFSALNRLSLACNNQPVYYLIHITNKCNARCAHCFYWREIENGSSHEDMRFEELEKISMHMGKVLVVNLCGAEPYMRNDLCEIVHLFASNNKCRLITIPSNGFLTERIVSYAARMCQENPDTFFRFAVSLDGPAEVHDSIRGMPGLFDKACETIRQLAELHRQFPNFAVLTNTVFSSQTQDHILDFLDWMQDTLPMDQSNVTFVRGNPCDPGTLDVHSEIYRKVINRLRSRPVSSEHNRGADSLLSYSMFLNTLNTVECANANPEERVFHCYGGKKFLVINHQAEVLPCELLDESHSLGNLRDFDYDIHALLASSPAKKNIQWVKEKHCACTWECAIQASKAFNPLQWPALGWRALRTALLTFSAKERSK